MSFSPLNIQQDVPGFDYCVSDCGPLADIFGAYGRGKRSAGG